MFIPNFPLLILPKLKISPTLSFVLSLLLCPLFLAACGTSSVQSTFPQTQRTYIMQVSSAIRRTALRSIRSSRMTAAPVRHAWLGASDALAEGAPVPKKVRTYRHTSQSGCCIESLSGRGKQYAYAYRSLRNLKCFFCSDFLSCRL